MKILLCAPYFSDDGLVGSKRMVSLARYLAGNGHQITAVRFMPAADFELDIPGVRCIDIPPKKAGVSSKLNYLYEKKTLKKAVTEELKKEKYDVFLTSVGPYSSFPAAVAAHKAGLPTVIDFRDLRAADPTYVERAAGGSRIKERILSFLYTREEAEAVSCADAITVVVPGDVKRMQQHHGLAGEKLHVILNGYDDAQLKDLPREQPDPSCFSVGYFGKFGYYAPEAAKNAILAIGRLRREGIDARLLHVGQCFLDVDRICADANCDRSLYMSLGSMSYRQGMAALSRANAYLIENSHPVGYGTKVFDYLYLDRPIILAVPKKDDMALARLLAQFQNTFCCVTADEIYEAMRQIIDSGADNLGKDADVAAYSRSWQNRLFEQLLERTASRR